METWIAAFDFSRPAHDAARQAAPLLARSGAKLRLLHVHPPAHLDRKDQSGAVTYGEEEEMRRALRRVADELAAAHPGLDVDVDAVASMSPADAILEEADRVGAAGIVMGTHGRTGLAHLVLGSVAERVVQRASVPVLVGKASA